MYIAFKWLVGLTLAMWILMCSIDVIVKRSFEIKQEGYNQKMLQIPRNTTIANDNVEFQKDRYYKHLSDKPHNFAFLPLFMFLAGALAVFMFNKKNEIGLFTIRQISEIYTSAAVARLRVYSEIAVYNFVSGGIYLYDLVINYSPLIRVHMSNAGIKLWNKLCNFKMRNKIQKPGINLVLLKKLQEVGKERKKISQLLIAAIQENKTIRMQYELEIMAKNRLVRYIENTQKLIKENRTSFVSFQQLYWVTHQENSFLKCRIQKITKEKEETEKNLLEIMTEVFRSKHSQLKGFCSRFIVKTADNLLNTDVGAEIQNFLHKPRATASNWQLSERPNVKVNSTSSWPVCAKPRVGEVIQDDILVPLVSNAPNLNGVPGEFVWTVKDKDGLITKLYEYDFTSDLPDGDTIRRIRQYSVYFEKDCLLDSINSRTVINNESSEIRPTEPPRRSNCRFDCTNYPITTQRFLTGSQAFQKFMKNNKNVIALKSQDRLP